MWLATHGHILPYVIASSRILSYTNLTYDDCAINHIPLTRDRDSNSLSPEISARYSKLNTRFETILEYLILTIPSSSRTPTVQTDGPVSVSTILSRRFVE